MHTIALNALARFQPGAHSVDVTNSATWGHQPGRIPLYLFDYGDSEIRQHVVWDYLEGGFEGYEEFFRDGRWMRDDLVPFAVVGSDTLNEGYGLLFLDVGRAAGGHCPVVIWATDRVPDSPSAFVDVAASVEALLGGGTGEAGDAGGAPHPPPPTPMESASKALASKGTRMAKNAAWRAVTRRLPRPLRLLLRGRSAVEKEAGRVVKRRINRLVGGCLFSFVFGGVFAAVLLFAAAVVTAAAVGVM